ncbi:hypothetical protein CLV51_104213 [Chitinophaga niastensis]|uniref:Uncharacterized protein n=1 Tax=Chitinophaga niastensis TaxID=536980 RepID=A0A2P8HH06_CHINA|nr:hypothetical protein [Chitinophaga niastensis]PSL45508.1 hypothetical protein CLV51_104213 [Chitinophaga niastensis]
MKGTRSENTRQSKQQPLSNMPKPEIRDNLDSRKNEEQDDKGRDSTHNHKDTKADKHKKK